MRCVLRASRVLARRDTAAHAASPAPAQLRAWIAALLHDFAGRTAPPADGAAQAVAKLVKCVRKDGPLRALLLGSDEAAAAAALGSVVPALRRATLDDAAFCARHPNLVAKLAGGVLA